MTAPRTRAIYGGVAMDPGYVVEFSRLIDNGMVFYWDASGPVGMRDNFANQPVEFAYLSLDTKPVQLWIKRSPPGSLPVVWDAGPTMPNFTLDTFLASQAASQRSAEQAADLVNEAIAAMKQMKIYAMQAIDAAARVYKGGTVAYDEWVTLFEQIITDLPTDAPTLPGSLWLNNGLVAMTDPTVIEPDGALVPSDVIALSTIIGLLPTQPPPQAGQLWNNNGVLTLTGDAVQPVTMTDVVAQKLQQLSALFSSLPTAPPPQPGAVWNDGGKVAVTPGVAVVPNPLTELNDPVFAVYPNAASALAGILPGRVQDAKVAGVLSRWANDNGVLVNMLAQH